ncbi:MAG: hypothetical protein ACTHOH_16110 [Lysobacteraceae bacterium]
MLCTVFVCGDAAAIFGVGDIVFDPTAVAKQIQEFGEQAKRWRATAEQYRMQLVNLSQMNFGASRLTSQDGNLPTVDPDYGVDDACRRKNRSVVDELLSLMRPDPNQEILDQQIDICRRLVRAENTRYNETVRYLNSLNRRQQDIQALDARRASVGKEPGKLQALSYDVERYQQAAKMDLDNWQATIVAYNNYIEQLNKYQQRLAMRALRGKQPDVVTAAVQGVLLHEALESRKNED